MSKKPKITYGQADRLNGLLGRLKIKSLASALFIQIITLKAAMSKVRKDFEALQLDVYKEFDIVPNYDGSIEIKPSETEKIKHIGQRIKDLSEVQIEVADTHVLSLDDLEALNRENDLNGNDLELMYELLIKEPVAEKV